MSGFSVKIAGHRGMGCTDNENARRDGNILSRPPENTLASFIEALNHPYLAHVEADVVRTKDDHLVLMHSVRILDHVLCPDAIAEIPDGKKFISHLMLEDVQKLRIGPNGDGRIPTLRDLLSEVKSLRPNNEMVLNLEVKDVIGSDCPRSKASIIDLLLAEIGSIDVSSDLIRFSSFSVDLMCELKKKSPQAKVAVLFAEQGENHDRKLFIDGAEKYLQFTCDNIEKVKTLIPDAELHPERNLTKETVRAAKGGIISSWALFEKSPLNDNVAADLVKNAYQLCKAENTPLEIITDHAKDMKKFISGLS
ncbi:MAG: glycerophosphodiester phosphodiesterase [Alphaproteobacteria bacterium]|nr:glycerophosphodiester phosphodiesterase [Alphaproteobacteria bacterium]